MKSNDFKDPFRSHNSSESFGEMYNTNDYGEYGYTFSSDNLLIPKPNNVKNYEYIHGGLLLRVGVYDDEYKTVKDLGKGTQGKVTLSVNKDGIQVAVKHIDMNLGKKSLEDISRELEALQRLSMKGNCHPNIVCYYDAFQDLDLKKIYIVMEYIEGETIGVAFNRLKMEKGKNFNEYLKNVLLTLVKALEFIHSKGIVHGDISMNNIMIRKYSDVPIFIDFGLSCDIAIYMQCNGVSGTPSTMDPSLLIEKTKKTYNDIWSLAMTIMILLGQDPWKKIRSKEELFKVLLDPKFQPKSKTIDGDLNFILNGMLMVNPEDRFTAKFISENYIN